MSSPSTSPNTPNSAYWNARWETGQTGWDIGQPSPALVDYMAQYPDKEAAILIPGCGNAHEAEALVASGFQNITLLDIAPAAVARLKDRFGNFPQVRILEGDFFQHKEPYDLMLEQTFFCALLPDRRADYARHAAALLRPGGRLAGILFNKAFDAPGPPFGGTEAEYRKIFEPHFSIQKMEPCTNSIAPRAGSELFINLLRR